ncbi:MAG: argininosuccinate lyase [Thermoplasmata archaeon]|nr:argininosuccinate lyase [Thermoplasmata archaeon]
MLRERFSRPLDPRAVRFSASTDEDAALVGYDLWGSMAHVRMLGTTGIIPRANARRLETELRRLARRAAKGGLRLDPALEDVHLNVEAELTRRLGAEGARLHTGRSRNDQVATDLALYTRDALLAVEGAALDLVQTLLERARSPDGRLVVAGWTHFQAAQRVYWAQWLATHAVRFQRDVERLAELWQSLDSSPLGSGAIAGSSLPLDREATAHWLAFPKVNPSSIDATGDRDFATDTLYLLARLSTHASGLAEELVVGAMPEVGRVRLDDAFVTTSSLMPHKRNPDLAELVRAEAAPALGRLVAHLTLLKGLPVGYQRDLQAGKPLLIDGVRRGLGVVAVLTPMIATARFLPEKSRSTQPTASVELADALVIAGVPFRRAHARVARFLDRLEREGGALPELLRADLEKAFPELEGTSFTIPRPEDEPERRRTRGGSSWREVERLLVEVEQRSQSAGRERARECRRIDRRRRELGLPAGLFAV